MKQCAPGRSADGHRVFKQPCFFGISDCGIEPVWVAVSLEAFLHPYWINTSSNDIIPLSFWL